jgi:hypothetical protein
MIYLLQLIKKQLYIFKKGITNIFVKEDKNKLKVELKKINYWHKYLSDNYGYIVKKYVNSELPLCNSDEYKIWVMWWQGEENMPEIIRINFGSLKRNSNGHEVVLITKDNYSEYIELPYFIIDKLSQRVISLTHLSDYIRVALLSKFGGLWLDATVYVHSPLPTKFNLPYWTNKWELKESESDSYNLWIGLWNLSTVPKLSITQYMGIWYSCPNNPIFICLSNFWLAFWKKENQIPYYWTTELFLIGIMYDNFALVKNMMDAVPINNPQCFNMRYFMNKKFEENILEEFIKDTQFFYLSWKVKYIEFYNKTNDVTFFGYLKNLSNNEK